MVLGFLVRLTGRVGVSETGIESISEFVTELLGPKSSGCSNEEEASLDNIWAVVDWTEGELSELEIEDDLLSLRFV